MIEISRYRIPQQTKAHQLNNRPLQIPPNQISSLLIVSQTPSQVCDPKHPKTFKYLSTWSSLPGIIAWFIPAVILIKSRLSVLAEWTGWQLPPVRTINYLNWSCTVFFQESSFENKDEMVRKLDLYFWKTTGRFVCKVAVKLFLASLLYLWCCYIISYVVVFRDGLCKSMKYCSVP